jgi:hypothetical protein
MIGCRTERVMPEGGVLGSRAGKDVETRERGDVDNFRDRVLSMIFNNIQARLFQ